MSCENRRDYWPRLRKAAEPYDGMTDWATEMPADVLAYLGHQHPSSLEMNLAAGLRKAGLAVRTGRLRIGQEKS